MNKTSIVGSIPKDCPEGAVFGRIGGQSLGAFFSIHLLI